MFLPGRIAQRDSEFLLFALTPPRATVSEERAAEIARITLQRLEAVAPDGLVLYDIDDESDRNREERPFPFLPTRDPADYYDHHLASSGLPAVVYRAVGKYAEDELRSWMARVPTERVMSVFVGASSREKSVATSLRRAHALRSQTRPDLLMGGVAIPERHTRSGTEHLRLVAKQEAGCTFFITQVIYDLNATKNLLSDYLLACEQRNTRPVPLVLTFSVCGSPKTLEFLVWLGVEVPRWIQNDLRRAADTLDASYHQALATATDLIEYCRRIGVPFGVNVESVSNRREEIEASVRLAADIKAQLTPRA